MWHPHDMATGFPLEQVIEESKVAAAVSFMTCPQKSYSALHTLYSLHRAVLLSVVFSTHNEGGVWGSHLGG